MAMDGALTQPEAYRFARRAPLDGMRGVLALLVVAFHLGHPFFPQGYGGVDGFFVLSGFVISSILIREQYRSHHNTINFWQFYSRRFKRLLPSSLLVILVATVVYRIFASDVMMSQIQGSLWTAALFSENFFLMYKAADYFAFDTDDSPVMHFWSLSVEEQFYFIFPIVFTFWMRWNKFQLRSIVIPTVVAVALALYQFTLSTTVDESFLYFSTLFRLYQLLAGVILGVIVFHRERTGQTLALWKGFGTLLSWIGFIGVFVISTPMYPATSVEVGFVSTLTTIALIVGFELNSSSTLAKLLSSTVFQFLGKHSYTIYLWHYPMITFLRLTDYALPNGGFDREMQLLILGAVIVLSWLTEIGVADPVRRLKWSDKQVATAAVIALLATCQVITIAGYVQLENAPATKDIQPSVHTDIVVAEKPTTTVPQSFPPPPGAELVDASYFFIGDSYAGEWRRALPLAGEYLDAPIHLLDIGWCVWFVQAITPNPACVAMTPYLELIRQYPAPRVVVAVCRNIFGRTLVTPEGVKVPTDSDQWPSLVESGLRASLDQLIEEGCYVVIMEAHPIRPFQFTNCLRRSSPQACNGSYPLPPWEEDKEADVYFRWIEVLHKVVPDYPEHVEVLNIEHIIAPGGKTRLLEPDGSLVWFDEYHVHRDWAKAHYREFAESLRPYVHQYPKV